MADARAVQQSLCRGVSAHLVTGPRVWPKFFSAFTGAFKMAEVKKAEEKKKEGGGGHGKSQYFKTEQYKKDQVRLPRTCRAGGDASSDSVQPCQSS